MRLDGVCLLLFIHRAAAHGLVEVDQMAVEVRTVYTGELDLAADRQTAAAAQDVYKRQDKNAEALDIGRDRVGQLEFTDIGQRGSLTNVGNQTRQEQNRIFDKERNGTQEKVMLERCQCVESCSQVFRSQFALERGCGLFQNVGKFTAALVEGVRRTDNAEKVARGVRCLLYTSSLSA